MLSSYRAHNVYAPFVKFLVNMSAAPTEKMIYNELLTDVPDVTAIGNRDLWIGAQKIDTRSVEITTERHGDKVSYHKHDEQVTFWKENGRAGLRPLLKGVLGRNFSDYMDLLARNAFGNAHFMMFSGGATAQDDTGFGYLTASNVFNADDFMKVWLKAAMNEVPMANNPTGPQGTIVGITTPGVIYDIQNTVVASSHWKSVQQYTNSPPISRYEVGQYKQARLLSTTRNILWNCGNVTAQTTVAADVTTGDGAPAASTQVYGAYYPGNVTGATNYVTLTLATGFSAGDIVSFHRTRETGGRAAWDDPRKFEREIYSVSGNNVVFTKPILRDLTASDTWYVTLGINVHMTVFPIGPNGVVAGVGQRPEFHTPGTIDDFESQYRFSWDARIKYQLMRPEELYVIFSAGTTDWN